MSIGDRLEDADAGDDVARGQGVAVPTESPDRDDASADADASTPPPADAGSDGGKPDASLDAGPVDSGPVDAGACNGFVRYDIPVGYYAYGKKCSGLQLSASVHVPPTQEECKNIVNAFDEQCIKWNAFTVPLSIYFKQQDSSDCDIQVFPKLDSGDTYKCTQNN